MLPSAASGTPHDSRKPERDPMSTVTLQVVFEFDLDGITLPTLRFRIEHLELGPRLPDEIPHTVRSQAQPALHRPSIELVADLKPGPPFVLDVRISNLPDSQRARADELARRLARELYRRSLLQFASMVERATPPLPVARNVIRTDSGEASTAEMFAYSGLVRVVKTPSAEEIEALCRDVPLRVQVDELPTSTGLYTAIDMFTLGMESPSKLARFFILYSALSVASVFSGRTGSQQGVDELLLARNPALPRPPSPRRTNIDETVYTKLRNGFVHWNERGLSPQSAIAAIEERTRDFQTAVADVLSHL